MNSQKHDHMESNNSTERSEGITSNDLGGIGRSYECVFCKGGFTTAQALGGHMNIHRKNRTKPKLNPSSSSSLNPERFLTDVSQSSFLSPCCKENRFSASSGTHPGVFSSHYSGQEETGKRELFHGGFNILHHVVEELDLELRLGHRSS